MVKRKTISMTKPRVPLIMAVATIHHGTILEASLISSAVNMLA